MKAIRAESLYGESARGEKVGRGVFLPDFSCIAILALFLAVAFSLGAVPQTAYAQDTAAYTVKFEGNWTLASTPGGVVGGAHFTTLIGAVHASSVTFWSSGGKATPGVEYVAELGGTSTFRSEVNTAISSGTAKSVVQKGVSGGGRGSATFEVTFTKNYPLLTLLSMIGPSPDWFVGVSGLSLLDGSDWRSSHSVDLFPYDAGTEDGEGFSLSNPATSPQGNITSIRGQGRFSDVRMARLTFTLKTQPPPQNNPPVFSAASAARSFTETVGDEVAGSADNVGAAVTATDQDGDSLTYTLEGTDAGRFTIAPATGQIRTKAGRIYDRETKASYSVRVRVADGNGGADTIDVTITVNNEAEPPLAPPAPSVTSAGTAGVNVMWNVPSNGGRPAIDDYDIRYRPADGASWADGPQGVPGTAATISGLSENTDYQVQVRAGNSDGRGSWSQTGSGRTRSESDANSAPVFSAASTTRSFTETVGDAVAIVADNVGDAVTAADQDGDSLAYTLEGRDAGRFSIDSNGQIKTISGRSYDRETRDSYSVIVMADDGNGGADMTAVTINVNNEVEPPVALFAPSVSSAGPTGVNVMWRAQSSGGRPPVTGYDLRYRPAGGGSWTDGPQGVPGTSAAIQGLSESTDYQVQVRASNSDGDSQWSQSGSGRTDSSGSSQPTSLPSSSSPPSMEAGEVDTDDELKEFVEDAAGRIGASGTFEETLSLLERFRDPGGEWNNGSMYLVVLTKKGGVYFHATNRDAEDSDWSGILFCEGGESVLDTRNGCFIEYEEEREGYAHPVSSSHFPLAYEDEEFILLGGFDKIPEGKSFTGEEAGIDAPSTRAGEVDTDDELKEFVENARMAVEEAVSDSRIDSVQIRRALRQEGTWRSGDVYVYIMDAEGRFVFDGADRNREQSGDYTGDIIAEAGRSVVEYTDGGMLRRAYAVMAQISFDNEDSARMYIVASEYAVMPATVDGSDDSGDSAQGSGGGCGIGESGSGGAFPLLPSAVTLLFALLLQRIFRRKRDATV